jgi:cobalamin biosynthesis protein CobT
MPPKELPKDYGKKIDETTDEFHGRLLAMSDIDSLKLSVDDQMLRLKLRKEQEEAERIRKEQEEAEQIRKEQERKRREDERKKEAEEEKRKKRETEEKRKKKAEKEKEEKRKRDWDADGSADSGESEAESPKKRPRFGENNPKVRRSVNSRIFFLILMIFSANDARRPELRASRRRRLTTAAHVSRAPKRRQNAASPTETPPGCRDSPESSKDLRTLSRVTLHCRRSSGSGSGKSGWSTTTLSRRVSRAS